MARKAVNYILKRQGGDNLSWCRFALLKLFCQTRKDFKIDVAINNYGDNPISIQGKMTSIDLLRMAKLLRAKVIIQFIMIFGLTSPSTDEILALWKMRKESAVNINSIHSSGKSVVNIPIRKDKDRIEYHPTWL